MGNNIGKCGPIYSYLIDEDMTWRLCEMKCVDNRTELD
jgi:hypothetical protein